MSPEAGGRATSGAEASDDSRFERLRWTGVVCGLTAGAWLGAAEAPTKLVATGLSPVLISLTMVAGVFLARWSLPALIGGTRRIGFDLRQATHLIVWAVMAGSLWAVANTLTIFAIRDIGLSIAFPLWNTNSLIGILWGALLFNELRDAGPARWLGVLGGAALMFGGAMLLAAASASQSGSGNAFRGVIAALAAGVLWGTMYIPYRKAYLTGMSPLSFIAIFTIGELGTMAALAVTQAGGVKPLWHELVSARAALFWLLLGGFVWVVGDLFQQYAVKYAGISRGIPLSNTNQLWGLLWGILVFGELREAGRATQTQVLGGSALVALGAGAIALSSAGRREHRRWLEAAAREGERYGVDRAYTRSALAGAGAGPAGSRRTAADLLIVAAATSVFVAFAAVAEPPRLAWAWSWGAVLLVAMLALLAGCARLLWRTTRFG